MKRAALIVALCIASALGAPGAHAALFRAYLSSNGLDANPCTVAYPCRLLPAALDAVAPGGEIWMLDSANYNKGMVTIDKSVSILAVPGEVGSISALDGQMALFVNAGGIDVTLRNVLIVNNALSPGGSGIRVLNANSVSLENSEIAGTVDVPVYVTGRAHVRLVNTVIRDSQSVAVFAEAAFVEIIECQLIGNRYGGILVQSTAASASTVVSMSDSVISGRDASSVRGVSVFANMPNTIAHAYVTRSVIFGTGAALRAEGSDGSPLIEASDSMIVGNAPNLKRNGTGVLRLFGNNHVSDGVTPDEGSPAAGTLR